MWEGWPAGCREAPGGTRWDPGWGPVGDLFGVPLKYDFVAFPGGSMVKNVPANVGHLGSIPGLGRFPWRRKWQPTPVFLSGELHGQRSLVGYSPCSLKELDITE